MSSYFVNSLFSKYKSGDSLRPNYYECGFAQDLAGSRPTVVYGPGSGATFQHAPQIQDFYHHSASTLPSNPYQQSPCAVTCHGEPGNFYGYDALQRQTLFGAQDADLVQYSDCKLGGAQGLGGEDAEGTEQSPSPTQLFPWMRPQGEETETFDLVVFPTTTTPPTPPLQNTHTHTHARVVVVACPNKNRQLLLQLLLEQDGNVQETWRCCSKRERLCWGGGGGEASRETKVRLWFYWRHQNL